MPDLTPILDRLRRGEKTRILFYGSSNTERRNHGLHWSDWLDLGIKRTYGRVHTSINTGLGGDTSRGLLARFDEDLAHYRPHLVFVTIGGNDSQPDRDLPPEQFRDNLLILAGRIADLSADLIFQTYYSADLANADPACRFPEYMENVRQVAAQTDSHLIDHLARWERLRLRHLKRYRRLMTDPFHVNPLGNMLIGLDLIRTFAARLADEELEFCREGLEYQRLLDALAAESS